MVGANKILTVSYGTFSCTLEGFDDPFSTMRGIAEYFRDLAADDRYFGAEPPTPDAEMLHRIAEREIQRRVEARVDDGGVVLRQLEDDKPQKAAPAEVAREVVETKAPIFDEHDVAEDAGMSPAADITETPVEAPETKAEETEAQDGDGVADKLRRIRAVVARGSGAAATSYIEDEHADELYSEAPIAAAFEDTYEDEAETAVEEVAPATEAFEEEIPADVLAKPEVTETETLEVEETLEEEVLEIEEEVLEVEEEVLQVEEEVLEVEEAAEADEVEVSLDSIMGSLRDDEDESEAIEEVVAEAPVELSVEDEDDVAVDLSGIDLGEPEVAEEIEADLDEVDLDAPEEALLLEEAEAPVEAEKQGFEIAEVEEITEDDADEALEVAEVDDVPVKALVRVQKMRRTDFEAAVAAGELEDISQLEAEKPAEDETSDEALEMLSDADEADLEAELAAVENAVDVDEFEYDETLEAETQAAKRALDKREAFESDDSETAERIFSKTDDALADTSGSARRSAIQHLRAAVQATRAEKRDLGAERAEESEQEKSIYRDDLERVVRPRRPVDGGTKQARPQAPLMLVSEQRVDAEPRSEAAAPVRPRRIVASSAAAEDEAGLSLTDEAAIDDDEAGANVFGDASSFAEFVEEMGATELNEILEAAAAYTSFVEGRDSFTRPQIMRQINDLVDDEDVSREAKLRSFGSLLREGKIKKIQRGQFRVSDSTRFKPAALMAGE